MSDSGKPATILYPLSVAAIRLLALWVLFQSIAYSLSFLSYIFGGYQDLADAAFAFTAGSAVFYSISSIILWVAAPWLAVMLYPRTASPAAASSLTYEDIQAITFIGVGVFLLARALPSLVLLALKLIYEQDAVFGAQAYEIGYPIAQLIIGLALIATSGRLARLFAKLRRL